MIGNILLHRTTTPQQHYLFTLRFVSILHNVRYSLHTQEVVRTHLAFLHSQVFSYLSKHFLASTTFHLFNTTYHFSLTTFGKLYLNKGICSYSLLHQYQSSTYITQTISGKNTIYKDQTHFRSRNATNNHAWCAKHLEKGYVIQKDSHIRFAVLNVQREVQKKSYYGESSRNTYSQGNKHLD